MKRYLVIGVAAVYAALGGLAGTQAVVGKQQPVQMIVQLGTAGGDFAITPSELKLQRGKLYKLLINNPSNSTHYFSAPGFGIAVWTSKIDVQGGEVKRVGFQNPRATLAHSAINSSHKVQEIELRPGGTAEWYLMPIRAGSYKFGCGAPAHSKAGMVGRIVVN